jgi:geranylgeranyl diphosphate synthase, type II
MESEGRPSDEATVAYIHRAKTGALIRVSVLAGGIVAGASEGELARLTGFGEKVGLAFQIADDILDVTSTAAQLGKTPGKDAAAQKATYPAVFGLAAAKARAHGLVEEAAAEARALGDGARVLESLARFVVARAS